MNKSILNIDLITPHPAQLEFLNSGARFKVLLAGRRFGKSLISQYISIINSLYGRSVAYVTPTHLLAKTFFNEVIKHYPIDLIKSANKSDLTIELKTGGSIKFISGEPEALENAFRGQKFHYVIIDEAAKIKDLNYAWNEVIRATLLDYAGKAIFISTPRGKDYFYSLYNKGLDESVNDWQSFHFTSYNNPHVSASELDLIKADLTTSAFDSEFLAIPSENANAVIASTFVNANIISEMSNEPTVVFGIDLAKYKDWTVIFGLSATGKQSHFQRFQKDWAGTKDMIKALPQYTLKVIDSTGVGDVVVEELAQSVTNIKGFKFTTVSKPQIVKKLALDIEKGNLKYTQPLANELSVFEYSYTSTGHIKYEASSGNTDDIVMAAALANFHLERSVPVAFDDRFYIGY